MDDRKGKPVVCPQGGAHASTREHKNVILEEEITIERRHPLSALKEEQGHSNSSLKPTKQNRICRLDPDHSWIG